MKALFTSYVINKKFSDQTLKIMTQKKSNVTNQLVSLIGLSVLISYWQDHTDISTNNASWFMTRHFIFVTSSILRPGLKTHLTKNNVFISEN